MPGFREVRRAEERARGAQNEEDIQNVIKAGGQPIGGGKYAISGGQGRTGGDDNFFQDPIVEALAKTPSAQEAEQYTGLRPSFYGVQRPGDWQRTVQRDMAADQLPGGREQLARLVTNRVERERLRGRAMA